MNNNDRIALLVHRRYVKKVKSALEQQSLLDQAIKITSEDTHFKDKEDGTRAGPRMVIPTTIPSNRGEHHTKKRKQNVPQKDAILADLGLVDLKNEVSISSHTLKSLRATPTPRNPVHKALREALKSLPDALFVSLKVSCDELLSSFPDSYTIYKPMLLLPHNTFGSAPWIKLLCSHPADSSILQPVWKKVAGAVSATHIAINAGIPLETGTSSLCGRRSPVPPKDNILRSPVNIAPLYGDFGPLPTPQLHSTPTRTDFDEAFWVSHTQNGIHQTWAPLYTMFSRGNIREKTRLLNLPSVLDSIRAGKGKNKSSFSSDNVHDAYKAGCTAVDLYAGIGYFAFSYKAGVSKVLCWELNPWSIEGLRRGAERNGWTTQIFADYLEEDEAGTEWANKVEDADFLVFQQSNEYALSPIVALHSSSNFTLPPIRHVNCGFLPSSRLSWPTAIKLIDADLGGWIHAHENVGIHDVEQRKQEVVAEMQNCLDQWKAEEGSCGSYRRRVRCEHVERVKTYAPGVLHVVFDIRVDGLRDVEDSLA
ncbi:hypothetical protein BU26DRAFT_306272 [Trematosphaeria pertusa]|uniref:tRNA(Phe) (4-demethylwyosine(37)-C(7)) aminocarboxypropyltransferase n=1 Tax=Trematosphaeria pertusa TaxID=390896 RepID=A0A6A6IEH5_9PLEO|nr:uncharacterized protein BU26DRAFT_306272 [Trematosphaeria pertusa]KAF2248811.1 hypothetical protein BU26DRAFT_306272 [Trematosphaeria pertusa]